VVFQGVPSATLVASSHAFSESREYGDMQSRIVKGNAFPLRSCSPKSGTGRRCSTSFANPKIVDRTLN
jgi:hypothetical protein